MIVLGLAEQGRGLSPIRLCQAHAAYLTGCLKSSVKLAPGKALRLVLLTFAVWDVAP